MTSQTTVSDYVTHPKDQATAERLWERFNTGLVQDEDLADPYHKMILADWRRCKTAGVSPTLRQALVLPGDELQSIKERQSFLLSTARHALDRVQDVLAGVPGILIFADAEGTILHVVGDPSVQEKAAVLSNLGEGGRWSEAVAGTNGIGTAIARKMPVHVCGSEHFCEGWHTWTCAGTPILNPFRDEVLGVIDFTTSQTDFRASAVALSFSLSSNIAAELRVQIEMERLQLLHHYSACSARFPSDAVLVYDRLGLLVRSSPGVDPSQYTCLCQDLTILGDVPKEVRPILVPGTETPIGTLLVIPRPQYRPRSLRDVSPQAPDVVSFGDFVTVSPAVKRVMGKIEKVASTDLSVLLIGETGTGKELIADYVHRNSTRRSGPFVAVNCGAISKELFESKFFGYERGGFTGADPKGRKGLFESAQDGTLFLDEIGELPLDMQAGLLRVLESGTFRRIGSERERSTNCRVVAATNRPLLEGVEKGTFRSDLYYRLSVAKAAIPPLRERREDIPVLIDHMMQTFCGKHGLPLKTFTLDAMRVLVEYDWPGNGRELRNLIEATIVCADDPIEPGDLPVDVLQAQAAAQPPLAAEANIEHGHTGAVGLGADLSIRDHEHRLILSALKKYRKISLVARSLGISRSTLYRRLEEFGIDPRASSTL